MLVINTYTVYYIVEEDDIMDNCVLSEYCTVLYCIILYRGYCKTTSPPCPIGRAHV